MNTDGVIVAALVIGIVVLANGLMFLWARSWARGDNATRDFLKGAQNAIGKPFEKRFKKVRFF
ncbi:MAG: hypothetical protein DWB59_06820 [Anaerolineae bacterium]|nr:hypothetical protein [Anaerolineae bacterium]